MESILKVCGIRGNVSLRRQRQKE